MPKTPLGKSANQDEIEQAKLEVERSKVKWAAMAVVVSLTAAMLTTAYSAFSLRETTREQTRLKLVEIALQATDPEASSNRAEVVAALLGDTLPQDARDRLKQIDFKKFERTSNVEPKKYLIKLLADHPGDRNAIIQNWIALFPGDSWASVLLTAPEQRDPHHPASRNTGGDRKAPGLTAPKPVPSQNVSTSASAVPAGTGGLPTTAFSTDGGQSGGSSTSGGNSYLTGPRGGVWPSQPWRDGKSLTWPYGNSMTSGTTSYYNYPYPLFGYGQNGTSNTSGRISHDFYPGQTGARIKGSTDTVVMPGTSSTGYEIQRLNGENDPE